MNDVTIVFADLTGSTGIFESLGNTKAAEIVTETTQWLGKLCEQHGGRVVKSLGDGVLVAFRQNTAAVEAVVQMQKLHAERLHKLPAHMKMMLKIGMARGQVVEQDGDCFGDPVNVASRLSDLSGPEQILATDAVVGQLPHHTQVRVRSLGAMNIRGRSEPCTVHRIEWQAEVASSFMTVQASFDSMAALTGTSHAHIQLSWLNIQTSFHTRELPIYLGRDSDAQFVVNDPRVSRQHAKIDRRGDLFTLEDVSSFGTWVRFDASQATLALRREECVLQDKGEIALGASFDDFSAPVVHFDFSHEAS
jgi:adenylate cyclase